MLLFGARVNRNTFIWYINCVNIKLHLVFVFFFSVTSHLSPKESVQYSNPMMRILTLAEHFLDYMSIFDGVQPVCVFCSGALWDTQLNWNKNEYEASFRKVHTNARLFHLVLGVCFCFRFKKCFTWFFRCYCSVNCVTHRTACRRFSDVFAYI